MIAFAGAGIALASLVGIYLKKNSSKKKRKFKPRLNLSKMNVDGLLDDDILEESEVDPTSVVNSDDEIDSEAETKDDYDWKQSNITKNGLKNIVKKARKKQLELKASEAEPKSGKDVVFYNLFACFAETACK